MRGTGPQGVGFFEGLGGASFFVKKTSKTRRATGWF